MITDYKRPKSRQEARDFVSQGWKILGGGSFISKHQENFQKVIDLQALGLSYCKQENDQIVFGAMATLQEIVDCSYTPSELVEIIKREKSFNIRNAASVAGTIKCSDGRSDILAYLVCAGASLQISGKWEKILPCLQSGNNDLIEEVRLDCQRTTKYEKISRTPDDFTIVGVFLSLNSSTQRWTVALNGLTEFYPLVVENIDRQEIKAEMTRLLNDSISNITNTWSSLDYQIKMINDLTERLLLKFDQ